MANKQMYYQQQQQKHSVGRQFRFNSKSFSLQLGRSKESSLAAISNIAFCIHLHVSLCVCVCECVLVNASSGRVSVFNNSQKLPFAFDNKCTRQLGSARLKPANKQCNQYRNQYLRN